MADPRKGEKLVVVFTEEAGDKAALVNIARESEFPNLLAAATGEL